MDFIAIIENKLGIEAKKEFIEAQSGDVNIAFADTQKAHGLFGYKGKTDVSVGL